MPVLASNSNCLIQSCLCTFFSWIPFECCVLLRFFYSWTFIIEHCTILQSPPHPLPLPPSTEGKLVCCLQIPIKHLHQTRLLMENVCKDRSQRFCKGRSRSFLQQAVWGSLHTKLVGGNMVNNKDEEILAMCGVITHYYKDCEDPVHASFYKVNTIYFTNLFKVFKKLQKLLHSVFFKNDYIGKYSKVK